MKQRVVVLLSQYLDHRVRGRIVRVRPGRSRSGSLDLDLSSLRPAQSAESDFTDDYIVAIEDVRDGRIHLLHSLGDLRQWLYSFKDGRCLQPAAAICGVCDRLHIDRGLDGELMANCLGCETELIEVYADLRERRPDD